MIASRFALRSASFGRSLLLCVGGGGSFRRALRLLLAARARHPGGRLQLRFWVEFGCAWSSASWVLPDGCVQASSSVCHSLSWVWWMGYPLRAVLRYFDIRRGDAFFGPGTRREALEYALRG